MKKQNDFDFKIIFDMFAKNANIYLVLTFKILFENDSEF